MKVFSERTFHILNMSGKVRISEQQLPRIYQMLPPICEKLGIKEPELYLELNRMPNAYTSGDSDVFVVVTSGLLEYLNDEEIRSVIAHECGHIACHHVLYHTMGQYLLSGAAGMLGLGALFTTALQIAFAYWMRCSEFSCDRAAAICAGSAEPVVDVMLRLAGGGKDVDIDINRELFMQQATEYQQFVDDSTWNKVLQFLVLKDQSHPLLSVRAFDITQWCASTRFSDIVNQANGVIAADGSAHCPHCGATVNENWAFCKHCGQGIK